MQRIKIQKILAIAGIMIAFLIIRLAVGMPQSEKEGRAHVNIKGNIFKPILKDFVVQQAVDAAVIMLTKYKGASSINY